MLRELRIENLLLIERAELRLGQGLNVITGETGAGKTVLAHSLDLLMGGKARNSMVRPGAEEAWVEGTFDLPADLNADRDPALSEIIERLPAGSDEITLGRRVSATGRSSAFIAGRSAPATDLALLGGRLLSFYGQHQHRRLTIASAQIEILDGFAGSEAIALRDQVAAAHRHFSELASELAELRADDGRRERDLDLLRFELEEIEQLEPRPDEKEELKEERTRLRNVDQLRASLSEAIQRFDGGEFEGGVIAGIDAAAAATEEAASQDPALQGLAERTRSAALEIEDLAAELRGRLTDLEADPVRLEQVEERLAELDRLERKHGGSIEAVLAHAERCRQRIEELEGGESREREVAEQLNAADVDLREKAASLSRIRKRAAADLEREMGTELAELAMAGATLAVELHPEPDRPGSHGAERVELLLAANAGLEPAPLRDAASGGELSRVMLALTGLAESGTERTAVFDEIDAGIGGTTAVKVGEKLKALAAGGGQVIAITHLPQVAAQASVHLRVVKDADAEPALANVERLEGEQIIEEIRRMMGAEEGDEAATRHARELVVAGRAD